MNKPVSSAAEAVAEPESKQKTTYTNWDTFVKAGLAVKSIKCECLRGHPADEACKTFLIPTAQNVINHVNAGHGGGFLFEVVEVSDGGRAWPGWKEFAKAGLEIQTLIDEVTDHPINLSVRAIKTVLRPHQGKFRGAWQSFHNKLLFVLQFAPPPDAGDDVYDDYSAEG